MENLSHTLINAKVQPTIVKVRNFINLNISFTLDFDLSYGDSLLFRFRGGRNNKNDWYFLQTHDPNKNGYSKLILNNKAKILPLLITGKDLLLKFFVCEKNGIKKDTIFNLKIYNTLVQSLVEKDKKIEILIESHEKELIIIKNPPKLDIINTDFDHITLIAPSIIKVNKNLKLLLRIEDKFKNLVEDFNGILELYIQSEGNNNLNTKISFQKNDKGFKKVDSISLKKPGLYSIQAFYNNTYFESNPIICEKKDLKEKLYWGFIHGHTIESDGIRHIDEYFNNLLKAGLDFGTNTEHDHSWETSNNSFHEIKKIVKKYHKENEFITFFAYEWGTWYSGYGDICVYCYDDNIPILRSELNKTNSIPKLIKNLKKYEDQVLLIAHHTALRPGYRNWNYFDDKIEKLVEIYSTWGNQEYPYNIGNPLPPRYKFFGYGKFARKKGPILEKKESFVLDALRKGYKLGFVAGGDDHFGIYPSGSIETDNGLYPPGIMAVWADNLSRRSIWDALMKRKCYGTTGPRVIIKFYIDRFFMGEIIDLGNNPHLIKTRNIKYEIISPINIEKIEILRNDSIFIDNLINSKHTKEEISDKTEFSELALINSKKNNEKFLFYYLRIFISENNMAWSSPIWFTKYE